MRMEWMGVVTLVVFLGTGRAGAIDQSARDWDHRNATRPVKEYRSPRPEAPPAVHYCNEECLETKDLTKVKDALKAFGFPTGITGYLDDRKDGTVGSFNSYVAEAAVGFAFDTKEGGHVNFGGNSGGEKREDVGKKARTIAMDAQVSKDKNTLVVTTTMEVLNRADNVRYIQYSTMTVTKLRNGLLRVQYTSATRPKISSDQLGTSVAWGMGMGTKVGIGMMTRRLGLGSYDPRKESSKNIRGEMLRDEHSFQGIIGPRDKLEKIQAERKQ